MFIPFLPQWETTLLIKYTPGRRPVEERRPLVTADGDEWDLPLSRRIACTGREHHEEIALPLPS
jgi:hypothetical protein